MTSYIGRASLLLLLVLGGCASVGVHGGRVAYEPLKMERGVASLPVLDAAEVVLQHLGAGNVTRKQGEVRAVVAVSPTVRNAIVVSVDRGAVLIDYRTEVATGPEAWLGSRFICPTYSYARERALAERIVEAARVASTDGTELAEQASSTDAPATSMALAHEVTNGI